MVQCGVGRGEVEDDGPFEKQGVLAAPDD